MKAWLTRRVRTVFLMLALATAGHTAVPRPGSSVFFPEDAQVFDIGTRIVINGLPTVAQGLVSPLPPAGLADWYRKAWGEPLMENRLLDSVVLGRLVDSQYVTVQIPDRPQRDGTSQAVVSRVDLEAARDGTARHRADVALWLNRLPAGSDINLHMRSQDGGHLSQYLAFSNRHGELLNRDRLKDLMRDDGYALADETVLPDTPASTLLFKAGRKEALVIVRQSDDGTTTAVINLTQTIETLP